MDIKTTLPIGSINLQQIPFDDSSMGSGLFAACLAEQMAQSSGLTNGNQSENRPEENGNTLEKKDYTGFFKKIQEEKMKELREKILEEMGLTEESLSKMPSEQRSALEKIIAREINQRMSAESALEEDKETDSIKKRLFLAELDSGMNFD